MYNLNQLPWSFLLISSPNELMLLSIGSIFKWINSHEKFVGRRNFIFIFYAIIEINPCNSTVCVYLNSLALDELCPKGFLAVFLKIKHNLIPPIIKFQGHWTLKRFNPCYRLIIGRYESPFDVLIIKYGHLKFKVFVKLF